MKQIFPPSKFNKRYWAHISGERLFFRRSKLKGTLISGRRLFEGAVNSILRYMHNFEFAVDFSMRKFRHELYRPELNTTNLVAEFIRPVQAHGLKDVSSKFDLGFHFAFLDTLKWTLTSIGGIVVNGIIVDVLVKTGCCKALGTCGSCFCVLITRRKCPNRPQISQPQNVINRQNLPFSTYPVNYTTAEDEVIFTDQPRNPLSFHKIRTLIVFERRTMPRKGSLRLMLIALHCI